MTCATIGPNGRPHLMPLWYVPTARAARLDLRESQKAKNLERDPHATVQVEDGVEYHELRGVMMECDVERRARPPKVAEYGLELFTRYGGGDDVGARGPRDGAEAGGRSASACASCPPASSRWDHSKLGGAY